MKASETRKGELFIYAGSLLWSLFPIITVLSYKTLPSMLSLAWSTFFAGLFLALIMSFRGRWKELRDIRLWKYCFFIALFIGVFFYSFLFKGLESTTPGNAAIIGLLEVFTSFIFFNIFRKEPIPREHVLGAVLMVFGALIVLLRDFSGINAGDLFILIAVFFPPLANMFHQRAREIASSESIMFVRSALSAPALFAIAYAFGVRASFGDVGASLTFLLLNGILILAVSKVMWIEAIHRISVTKGVALSSISPPLTLLFAWILLHQAPALWQIAGLVPMMFGVMLLTNQLKLRTRA